MLVLDMIWILKVRDACLITKVTSFLSFFFIWSSLKQGKEKKMQGCDGLDVKESLKFGRHVTYRCLSTGLFWAIKRIIFKPDAQINQNTMQCCGMEVIFGCVLCFPVLPEIKFFFFFPDCDKFAFGYCCYSLHPLVQMWVLCTVCISGSSTFLFAYLTWGVCVCVCVHVCTCVWVSMWASWVYCINVTRSSLCGCGWVSIAQKNQFCGP